MGTVETPNSFLSFRPPGAWGLTGLGITLYSRSYSRVHGKDVYGDQSPGRQRRLADRGQADCRSHTARGHVKRRSRPELPTSKYTHVLGVASCMTRIDQNACQSTVRFDS